MSLELDRESVALKIQHLLFVIVFFFLVGCSQTTFSSANMKVGLLLEDTIDDQGWNSKGYQGLLNIHTKMGIDVVFQEEVKTFDEIERSVARFEKEGVKLLFGHGRIFADAFTVLAEKYPSIHFVSFNGHSSGENVTNVLFNSYSMGFFAGFIASLMSESGHIGVIAAYPWQPEIEGFKEGARIGNASVTTHVQYVYSWTDEEKALNDFHSLAEKKRVDVFYPTGDGYHIAIIEAAKEKGLFVIGFVSDLSDLGRSSVLTSTIQHVDRVYEQIARMYVNGELKSGDIRYDFDDEILALGDFSPEIPSDVRKQIEEVLDHYMETGELPSSSIALQR